jgi:hypothetical protein
MRSVTDSVSIYFQKSQITFFNELATFSFQIVEEDCYLTVISLSAE